VSYTSLSLHLPDHRAVVLDPTKKMSYFCKHWAPDLISDVESAIHIRVSSFYLFFVFSYALTHCNHIQFLERAQVLQISPSLKTTPVRKAPPSRKSSCPNVDDTDTKEDDGSYEAAVGPSHIGMDKFNMYLNTMEDIPDGMDIVHWWGVSFSLFRSSTSLIHSVLCLCS
jgi:hypothetical protein